MDPRVVLVFGVPSFFQPNNFLCHTDLVSLVPFLSPSTPVSFPVLCLTCVPTPETEFHSVLRQPPRFVYTLDYSKGKNFPGRPTSTSNLYSSPFSPTSLGSLVRPRQVNRTSLHCSDPVTPPLVSNHRGRQVIPSTCSTRKSRKRRNPKPLNHLLESCIVDPLGRCDKKKRVLEVQRGEPKTQTCLGH